MLSALLLAVSVHFLLLLLLRTLVGQAMPSSPRHPAPRHLPRQLDPAAADREAGSSKLRDSKWPQRARELLREPSNPPTPKTERRVSRRELSGGETEPKAASRSNLIEKVLADLSAHHLARQREGRAARQASPGEDERGGGSAARSSSDQAGSKPVKLKTTVHASPPSEDEWDSKAVGELLQGGLRAMSSKLHKQEASMPVASPSPGEPATPLALEGVVTQLVALREQTSRLHQQNDATQRAVQRITLLLSSLGEVASGSSPRAAHVAEALSSAKHAAGMVGSEWAVDVQPSLGGGGGSRGWEGTGEEARHTQLVERLDQQQRLLTKLFEAMKNSKLTEGLEDAWVTQPKEHQPARGEVAEADAAGRRSYSKLAHAEEQRPTRRKKPARDTDDWEEEWQKEDEEEERKKLEVMSVRPRPRTFSFCLGPSPKSMLT